MHQIKYILPLSVFLLWEEPFFAQNVGIIDSIASTLNHSSTLSDTIKLARAVNLYGESLAKDEQDDAAILQFKRVLNLFPSDSRIEELGYTYNNLGSLYSRNNDPGSAIPFIQTALEIFSKILGPDHLYIGVIGKNLAMQYGRLKNYQKKIDWMIKSDSILALQLPKDNPRRLDVLRELSLAYQSIGELANAKAYLNSLIQIVNDLPADRKSDRLRAFDVHTAFMSREGEKFPREIILESYSNYISQLEMEFGKYHKDLRDLYNNYALELMKNPEDNLKTLDFLKRAFLSQYGLSDTINSVCIPTLKNISNPSTADLKLLGNMGSLMHQLFEESGNSLYLDTSINLFVLGDSIAELMKTKVFNLDSRVILKGEHLRFYTHYMTSCEAYFRHTNDRKYLDKLFLNLEKLKSWELIENLTSNKLIAPLNRKEKELSDVEGFCRSENVQWMHFFGIENGYGVILINEDTTFMHIYSIGRDSINSSVIRLLNSVGQKEWTYGQLASQLYDFLITPLAPYFNKDAIIISPFSHLRKLPFEMLISTEPTFDQFERPNYLMDQFDISYQISATFGLLTYQPNRFVDDFYFYAPNYDVSSLKLNWNQNEVEKASKFVNGIVVENADDFYSKLSDNGWIHFAGHTVANEEYLDSTYMILENDTLYLTELMNSTSNSDMIVLSSCASALGKSSVEAMMGSAYGFAVAGTYNSISTLWEVNDRTSVEIFNNYYHELSNGKNSVVSLTDAKKIYLDQSPKPGQHPYYWANSIYYGHPLIYKSRSNNNLYLILLCFLLGSIVIFILTKKLR